MERDVEVLPFLWVLGGTDADIKPSEVNYPCPVSRLDGDSPAGVTVRATWGEGATCGARRYVAAPTSDRGK